MSALRTSILIVWVVFWIYWLVSALGAKQGSRTRRTRPVSLLIIIIGFLTFRIFRPNSLAVHSPILQVVGVISVLSGLGVAVWARVCLGRNWGMPMTQKDEPELVTSGPYQLVRHPIYSGILLAVLGTALCINIYWLLVLGLIGIYFVYSARVEEGLLASSFPTTYPSYTAKTKMLIPFVL
jgi:protein-S-isoprenylcysteine O-methyltransferase Ste14